ncbi:hypothetical protein VMCG_06289 [Cytospora schulzeri]|uniref:superoxide dismutase n=1 Tax=Cytospora schulzeri TaxID=448051 RepID=A0A423W982_9PEZI|nr:hypothetical protein VMCG_06289 [Valsa malicola]
MYTSTIVSLLSAVATAAASSATVVTNNPIGAAYTATLPATAFDKDAYPDGGNVKGYVYAASSPDGTGVIFQVKFSGLPSEGGPFLYHIHDQPVPADGNCTATSGHLDPFLAGETPSCDASAPETCQVGDLSGKYGKITSDPFSATYTDDYASLVEGLGSFFANRSIVVHTSDKTRITCANFTTTSTSTTSSSSACSSGAASSSSSVSTRSVSSFATTRGVSPSTSRAAGGGSNATATYSTPSASSSIVTAGGSANAPALMLAAGAAALAYAL